MRPSNTEFAPFYIDYVSRVPESDVLPVLESQPAELLELAGCVRPDRETFRYGPDKWSIRELFGHIVDAERVFGHRAFCISRGEQQPLPGFDENEYMAQSNFTDRPLTELASDFSAVREANLSVLRRLRIGDWDRVGNANGSPTSVRALAFIMAGHVRHHVNIVRERYGVSESTVDSRQSTVD